MSGNIFSYLESLEILLAGVILCFAFVQEWIGRSKRRVAVELLLVCCGYALITLVCGSQLFNYLIVFFLAMAVIYYQKTMTLPMVRTVFYLLLVANLIFLACGLSEGLYTWLFSAGEYVDYSRHSSWVDFVVYTVVLGCFTVLAGILVRRVIAPMLADAEIKNWKPLCLIALLYNLAGLWLSLPFRIPAEAYTLLCLLLLVTFAATYALLLRVLQSNAAAVRAVAEGEMKQLLVELEKKEYLRLSERLDAARRSHHDLRHQIAVLQGLVRQGNMTELDEYLQEMTVTLPTLSEGKYCDNPAANALINHYLSSYPEIEISLALQIPADLPPINDSDLCVVLGNLLENALEACTRLTDESRFVTVRAGVQQGYFIITVDNSFDGHLQRRAGAFASRKRSGGELGLGLSSVQAICEKYRGFCSFEGEDTVFKSSAALRISE